LSMQFNNALGTIHDNVTFKVNLNLMLEVYTILLQM
jgi:hypothetical protein